MKKKGLIIASLLVLVMSFVFLGCPPPEDNEEEETGNAWDISSAAVSALSAIGVSNLPDPGAGTFIPHKTNSDGGVILGWSGCSATEFSAYKTKIAAANLGSVSVARDIPVNLVDTLTLTFTNQALWGSVYYSTAAGDKDGFSVGAGAIVVYIGKD